MKDSQRWRVEGMYGRPAKQQPGVRSHGFDEDTRRRRPVERKRETLIPRQQQFEGFR